MILKSKKTAVGLARKLCFWCPGCDEFHTINVPEHHDSDQPMWSWNGDYETPTIRPSILVNGLVPRNPAAHRCHSFIENGRWRFLNDCTHRLAGQTVDMVDIPEGEV